VLGKTNLHELSFGWTSNNQAFGPVRNPYDPARIAGGSSGGTAVAVAARMAPLGVAEDTEGSIRVPAALSGIAGFRPTTGRYPSGGVMPISPLFDQAGPHARTVADLALFDSVVARERAAPAAIDLPGVKLALGREYWFRELHPEVERITGDALRKLEEAGAELIEVDVSDLGGLIELTTTVIQGRDFRPAVAEYLARYRTGVHLEQLLAEASPDVRRVIAEFATPGGRHFPSDAAYLAARDVHLPRLRAACQRLFADSGAAAVVFPAVLVPAPCIGEDRSVQIQGATVSLRTALARNIAPASTAGLPGLVVPAGLTAAGMPVGLEFDAPAGADRLLLALGRALEGALGPLPAPVSRRVAREPQGEGESAPR
jgi:indoleacetamide hydrolase